MEKTKTLDLVVTHHNREIDGVVREWYSFDVHFIIDGDPYIVGLNPKDQNGKKMLINQAVKKGCVIEATNK